MAGYVFESTVSCTHFLVIEQHLFDSIFIRSCTLLDIFDCVFIRFSWQQTATIENLDAAGFAPESAVSCIYFQTIALSNGS